MNTDDPDPLDRDLTGYDPTTETYHAYHDWTGSEPLAATIVEAVSVVRDEDPTTIPPLYDAIDPEALEELLRSFRRGPRWSGGMVEFSYHDRAITVSADGEVCVACDPATDFPEE